MKRRNLLAVFAVLFGLIAALLTPSAAHAVDPLPGPVDELLDVPSRVVKSATGSPVADTVMMMLKNQRWTVGGGTLATIPPPVAAKPITAPGLLARGAGGPLLGALFAGFAIGEGGLHLYSMTTGADVLPGVCGSGFEFAASVMYVGLMPDCSVTPVAPNEDTAASSSITWGAKTLTYAGSVTTGGASYYCFNGTHGGSFPGSGYNGYRMSTTGMGWVGPGSWGNSTSPCHTSAGGPANGLWVYAFVSLNYSTAFQIKSVATGEVVATSVETSPNPVRTARCRIAWEDGTETMGTGSTYTETAGIPLSAAGLGCESAYVSKPGRGPALLPSRIDIESDAGGGAITEIASQDVPEFSPDERKAFEVGNGRGLVLERVTGTVANNCLTWAADCSGWWDATSAGTSPSVGGDTYRCTFAGQAIALVECGAYRNTFDTQTQTPTITHPSTGEDVGWSAAPNTGNSINPGTGPGTTPGDVCMDSYPSLANPIDWVLHPVKCASVWAFVPRAAVVDAGFATVQTRWQSTAVGALFNAVTAWSFVAPSSSGCDGITVGLSVLGNGIEDFQILNACSGPLQPVAALSTLVIGIGVVLTSIRSVTASIGGIVGMRPLASAGDAT